MKSVEIKLKDKIIEKDLGSFNKYDKMKNISLLYEKIKSVSKNQEVKK